VAHGDLASGRVGSASSFAVLHAIDSAIDGLVGFPRRRGHFAGDVGAVLSSNLPCPSVESTREKYRRRGVRVEGESLSSLVSPRLVSSRPAGLVLSCLP
jgi:hypothetical protein